MEDRWVSRNWQKHFVRTEEEQRPARVSQASGIKKVFLEETPPELDLEGEEQVNLRKISLGSGEELPHRGRSMCSYRGVNFSRESWWMNYEKLLSKLFPLLSSGHTGWVKCKEFSSWRWWGRGGTKPSQTSLGPVSWCSFLSLSFLSRGSH